MTQEEQDDFDRDTELFNEWLYGNGEEGEECDYKPDPMTTSKALREDFI